MVLLFPSPETVQNVLVNPVLGSRLQNGLSPRGTPYQARPELYSAYSVVDDAKNKAKQLSDEAAKEFDLAAKKAQGNNGKIELYSSKYYAACTFGGLLACVSLIFSIPPSPPRSLCQAGRARPLTRV